MWCTMQSLAASAKPTGGAAKKQAAGATAPSKKAAGKAPAAAPSKKPVPEKATAPAAPKKAPTAGPFAIAKKLAEKGGASSAKASAPAPSKPAEKAPAPVANEDVDADDEPSVVATTTTTTTLVSAPSSDPSPPQDHMVPYNEIYMQIRGAPNETNRVDEKRSTAMTWSGTRTPGEASLVQKVLVPSWAGAYKLSLELSSDPAHKF